MTPQGGALETSGVAYTPASEGTSGPPCAAVCTAAATSGWLHRLLGTAPGSPPSSPGSQRYAQIRSVTPLVPTRTLDCLLRGSPVFPAAPLPHGEAARRKLLHAARPQSAPGGSGALRSAAVPLPRAAFQQQRPVLPKSGSAAGRRLRPPRSAAPGLRRALQTPRPAAPASSADGSAEAVPGSSLAQRPSAAGLPTGGRAPPEDECSPLERLIVDRLSAARRDPAAFAEALAEHYLISQPYLDEPAPLGRALQFCSRLNAAVREVSRRGAQLGETEAAELQELRGAWEQDDLAKTAKGKKKPAAKKGQKDPGEEEEERRRAEHRAQALAELRDSQAARRAANARQREEKAELLQRCHDGCSLVQEAVSAVGSAAPLGPLQYSRGLSVLAREHCAAAAADTPPEAAGGSSGGPFRLTHAGMRIGASALSITLGSSSPQTAAWDLAVDDSDAERRNRAALLHPRFRVAGCAWQPHPTRGVCCVVMYAESWLDCMHIHRRPFYTLEQLQRSLRAQPDALQFPIAFASGMHVTATEPRTQPVPCDNTCVLRLRFPRGAAVAVALHPHPEQQPGPPSETEDVFSQRVGEDEEEVVVRLPSPGSHTLAVHARAAGAAGFVYIGPVLLHCKAWRPQQKHLHFPVACGAFLRRRVRVLSPLYTPLTAGAATEFEVVVPAGVNFNKDAIAVATRRLQGKAAARQRGQQLVDRLRAELPAATARKREREREIFARQQELRQLLQEPPADVSPGAKKRKPPEGEAGQEEVEQELLQLAAERSQLGRAHDARLAALRGAEGALRRLQGQCRAAEQELARLEGEQQGPPAVELLSQRRRYLLAPGADGETYCASIRPEPGGARLLVAGSCVLSWAVSAPPVPAQRSRFA
eukprot:TRINITY_DN6010_c1_g5_i1.p1 TRINITY_DN6010_c1_g5~~TRINITY_DN6010_c1_g5_i1.p1  ORF type:complete len:897 (+),score=246.40 TRINITY_DN6010_c1_g5_i1:66-2693(+)